MKRFKKTLGILCLLSVILAPDHVQAQVRMPAGVRPSSSISSEGSMPESSVVPSAPQAIQGAAVSEYVLGIGDRIRLTVFGEAELSGDYEVNSTGVVSMPLIGDVPAAGQPTRHFEEAVRRRLSDGYLRDPRVSAQVINYRPFFILGEVAKPGSYPFVNGMTVVNAVALAGGYTYRADRKDIRIKYANDPEKKEVRVPEEASVMPGDVIRVPERFF